MLTASQSLANEELSTPLLKGSIAPFDGVLVPPWQIKELVTSKSGLSLCLEKLDQSACPERPGDSLAIPEALYWFGGGLAIGFTSALLLK